MLKNLTLTTEVIGEVFVDFNQKKSSMKNIKYLVGLVLWVSSISQADSSKCLVYIENKLDGRENDAALVNKIKMSALSVLKKRGYTITTDASEAQYQLTMRYSFAENLERFANFEDKKLGTTKSNEVSGSVWPWGESIYRSFKKIIKNCNEDKQNDELN